MNQQNVNLWSSADHAQQYLTYADRIPHRKEGELTLLEFVPETVGRVLDIGTGDGRLLEIVRSVRPGAYFTALDFSPTMLEAARRRFEDTPQVRIVAHDFANPFPSLGSFDCVISSFAIHHVPHARKRELYAEVFQLLSPGGSFCNLEHVASSTLHLHHEFLKQMDLSPEQEDPSNKLLDVKTQLDWLSEIGFVEVDCHWKWRELALLAGTKPS